MDLTAETLAISLAFLLPGFVANRLANYYSPTAKKQESTLDATLSSLAISVGVFFLQAFLASVALAILWWGFRSNFDNLELTILAREGIEPYLHAQPLLLTATIGAAALTSYILGAWLGYYDVVRKVLRPRLTSLELAEEDPWYLGLQAARRDAGKAHMYVEVTRKSSGEVVRGIMRGFSSTAEEDGSRDLVLEAVRRKKRFQPEWSIDPAPGLTILNSTEFENLRVVFSD